jgi:light-regulated signal transduction histidine kinase (bacteriophytochrome)
VIRDVTERKKARQALAERQIQLERANEDLRRKNAELDEFTYIASHDLQEPLRKLTAFTDLLRKDAGGALPERAAKDLGFIVDAAQRMQTLVQDLLLLSRAGKSAMKRERISLAECARAALDALAMRIEATGARIIQDDLPEVWGDRTMMTQLYQNLIGNALKFIGPRKPVVHLTLDRDAEGEITLGVKDNGIGLKQEYAEQIFAPFKRLHGRDKYEGSGIGLSICRKCVERHGGRIWVESQSGEGAHFRFTLGERTSPREIEQGAHHAED